MTSSLVRLYALVLAVLLFFLAWAIVAARPWQARTAAPDPGLAALDARRRALRAESVHVRQVLARRWNVYRTALRRREHEIAAARARARAAELAAARAGAAARLASVPAPAAAAPAAAPLPAAPRVVYVQAPVATTRTS